MGWERILQVLGWPSRQMLIERAVEHAVISGAEVTTLPAGTPECPRFRTMALSLS